MIPYGSIYGVFKSTLKRRACWDILPHGANSKKKAIDNVDACERCGQFEDNVHVLLDCPWARQIWDKAGFLQEFLCHNTFREWLGLIMEQKTQEEVEMFCVCAQEMIYT